MHRNYVVASGRAPGCTILPFPAPFPHVNRMGPDRPASIKILIFNSESLNWNLVERSARSPHLQFIAMLVFAFLTHASIKPCPVAETPADTIGECNERTSDDDFGSYAACRQPCCDRCRSPR